MSQNKRSRFFYVLTILALVIASQSESFAVCKKVYWANGGKWGKASWDFAGNDTWDNEVWENYQCVNPGNSCDKWDWVAMTGCSINITPPVGPTSPPSWLTPQFGLALIQSRAAELELELPSDLPEYPTMTYWEWEASGFN